MFLRKKQTANSIDALLTSATKERDHFLKNFIDYVENHKYILIFQHINPDGDCVGCSLGLKQILKNKYPQKHIYSVGASHGLYPWLTQEYDEVPPGFDYTKALAVIVDVGASNRIDFFNEHFRAPDKKFSSVVKIDHHGATSDFELDLYWDDPTYVASACQILQICEYYGWYVDSKAATYLYLGLVTDSGYFGYDNTLPRSLIIGAKLLRYGADGPFLHKELTARTFKSIATNAQLMNYVQKDQNLIWIHVTKKMREELDISNKSGIVKIMENIEENIMWISFFDNDEGKIEVNLRSIGVEVRGLAIEFGGGGHANAAGCLVDDIATRDKLLSRAQEIVSDYIKEHGHKPNNSDVFYIQNDELHGEISIYKDEIELSKNLKKTITESVAISQENIASYKEELSVESETTVVDESKIDISSVEEAVNEQSDTVKPDEVPLTEEIKVEDVVVEAKKDKKSKVSDKKSDSKKSK